ncbi:hypothetical protein BX667DRAFT_8159 [Coemansia mojavensis]|nr:hypothetical protein BX667DRAFT_8159 [Coemansia mojavensis]
MTMYSIHKRPTIIALSDTSPVPTKLLRRSNTSASRLILVPDMPFNILPPLHGSTHTSDGNFTAFDNIPPLPYNHGINGACFGMPYAQRCNAQPQESQAAAVPPQPSPLGNNSLQRRTHIRRAGRVKVDVRRLSTLEKATGKVADLFRFRNRPANNRQLNNFYSTFGKDQVQHHTQPQQLQPTINEQATQTVSRLNRRATMPASAAAFVADSLSSMPSDKLIDGTEQKNEQVDKPARAEADCSQNDALNAQISNKDVAIYCISGVTTLSAHKPQLVTISTVGDKYTIVPSHA